MTKHNVFTKESYGRNGAYVVVHLSDLKSAVEELDQLEYNCGQFDNLRKVANGWGQHRVTIGEPDES